jgi:hypothetical protein
MNDEPTYIRLKEHVDTEIDIVCLEHSQHAHVVISTLEYASVEITLKTRSNIVSVLLK